MPLYDGDMVNLLTPDGRAVSMPSGLAANFPGLQPFPAPPPMPAAPAPDQTGVPTPAAPPIVPPTPQAPGEGPITDPSQLPPATGSPSIPQGPVTSPAEDAGVPRRPAPEPSPTRAQLIKEGPAGTLAAQNTAIDKQQAAIDRSAQVEADAATQEGHAMAQRDAQTQQILAERAKQAAANEAELNARIQARDQLADQIAKTRIDRSVDHPIWAQIGLVLSMLGTAMTRRPGEAWNDPAYNTLQQLLDKKVAGQMADVEQRRMALAQMNVGVTEQRQHNVDRLTEIDARKDAAIQQAQQAVQTIAMQMKSPAALAGAQQLNAKLDETRADLRGQAGQRYQDQMNVEAARAQAVQMHRESLGMQYRIHSETMAATEREKMAEVAQRALAAGDKATAERAKAVQERAIGDPRTGSALLTPAGQAKMDQADKAEAQARQQQDPAQAQKLRDYAGTLRQSATLNDAALAPTTEAQKELTKQVTSAQDITDRIGDTIDKLQAGPGVLNREAWSSITTDLGNIAGKYQQAMGERVSTKAFEQTMQHILNFDPDSLFQRAASKDKAIESLKTLKGMVASDVDAALKGNRMQTGWKPQTKTERGTSFGADEKTAAELANDRTLGYLTPGHYTDAEDQAKEQAISDAEARPGSEAGLSPNATTHIKALAARAATAGDAEHDRIVQALANPISDGLREGGRNTVSMGMLEVLRNSAPAVYEDVVKSLPASDQKEIRGIEASIRKAPNVPNVPSRFDPSAPEEEDPDVVARRAAAFAPFQPGAPLRNSPGAGPSLGLRTNR
jgi:hypothetical protein